MVSKTLATDALDLQRVQIRQRMGNNTLVQTSLCQEARERARRATSEAGERAMDLN